LPLLRNFQRRDFFACIYAPWFPSKTKLPWILRCVLRGVIPASAERPQLDALERAEIAEMQDSLQRLAGRVTDKRLTLILEYVVRNILEPGRLVEMARDVKHIERLLEDLRPQAVLSDGLDYYLSHILFFVAKKHGIATIGTWHGQYLQDVRMNVLGSDPRIKAPIDWFFTWGRANEAWLANIGSTVRSIRTGNPVAISASRSLMANRPVRRVLLLQFVATGEDHLFPQAIQYDFTVRLVRELVERGSFEVQLKIHPGPYSRPYYEAVANHFGLELDIRKDEAFKDSLAWADIVIGPAVSGAMLEVLGTGKPYYPVVLRPSAVNRDYLADCPIYEDIDGLFAAIQSNEAPDWDKLLENHAALGQFSNPATRTWDAMAEVLAERRQDA